jgi:hypothetical protein
MEKDTERSEQSALSTWTMEIVVALVIMALGGLVIFDSIRLGGAAWKSDGPGSGYFPFYVGSLIILASAYTLIQALRKKPAELGNFLTRGQARSVLSVLLPTILYTVGIQFIGIYVASAIFIAAFMRWFGKYHWIKAILLSVSINVLFFFTFEVWFLIPLRKGPIEQLFGY